MKIQQITEQEYRVGVINSIQKKYKGLRQESKSVTFALQYLGTYLTLMNNSGFPKEEAISIENNYHSTYKVSKAWIDKMTHFAETNGYVVCAFGLKLRTPLLKASFMGVDNLAPKEALAEKRTAMNAIQQSWGLLNTRAGTAFMQRVRRSPDMRLDVRPLIQIHDSQYYLIKNNLETLKFLNKHLIAEVNWANHPNIKHDKVGLGGDLSVFYPRWDTELTIPNHISDLDLLDLISNYIEGVT